MPTAAVEDVLRFWFQTLQPRDWWRRDSAIDADVERRFGTTLDAATRGELYGWRSDARGRLAEVIVLDQFARNIHRDTARAFATDPVALVLAQEAVAGGADQTLPPFQRVFFYLPYMHSESLVIHDAAQVLFAQPGLEDNRRFELRHREILERFGRYPHRNAALGRDSTPAEIEFLRQPGSAF